MVKVRPFGSLVCLITDGAKKEADFFMFFRLTSPKGGMRLNSLHTWPAPHQENVRIEKIESGVVNDYFCLKVGYSEVELKKGDPVFIKPSDAKELYQMLKRELGNS